MLRIFDDGSGFALIRANLETVIFHAHGVRNEYPSIYALLVSPNPLDNQLELESLATKCGLYDIDYNYQQR